VRRFGSLGLFCQSFISGDYKFRKVPVPSAGHQFLAFEKECILLEKREISPQAAPLCGMCAAKSFVFSEGAQVLRLRPLFHEDAQLLINQFEHLGGAAT
jgi:hypothetical protein